MTILRVGLVGLGEVAQSIHLPVLRDQRHLWRVAGVFDLSQSLMDLCTAQIPGVVAFPSAEALIASPDIDAVFILSADETHAGLMRTAIAARKHILLEKPACLNLREIDELIALSRGYDRTIFVGYMRRYASAYVAAKAELPPFEDITHVRIFDLITVGRQFLAHAQHVLYPDDIDPEVLRRGMEARKALIREVVGEDAPDDLIRAYHGLTSLSSHHISAMRGLLGEPRGVLAAHCTNGGVNTSVMFDYGHFIANYDALIDDLGVFDAMIEVRSNAKRVRIVYDTPYIRSLPTRLEVTEASPAGPVNRTLGPIYADAFSNELVAFHRHVIDGTKPVTDLEDSRRDLVLFAKAAEKMRQAKP